MTTGKLLGIYRTHAQPETGRSLYLSATLIDGRVVFSGGKFGTHSVCASSTDLRGINQHWRGYCAAQHASGRAAPKSISTERYDCAREV